MYAINQRNPHYNTNCLTAFNFKYSEVVPLVNHNHLSPGYGIALLCTNTDALIRRNTWSSGHLC